MNKLKLFLENFLVYGLGGIISNIIPMVMIPIVTRIMPGTEFFGISDMSNTVVAFGCALAVMGMYDAMYRMFFEKDDENYKRKVCSTTLVFTLIMSIIVFIVMILVRDIIAQYFFKNREYAFVVYISAIATLVSATNSIISAPTRMQNKRKVFLITNTLSPIISYSISIPMLLAGHYVIALPLAGAISGITMEISFGFINRNWFKPILFDKKLLKQLLFIAVPLVPNFLIYWIFNSCDKVMITNMIGLGAAGIYSVGSKLGYCSQLIYTAFAGGWQYFTFISMTEKDQVKNNSLIFEYLGVLSFVATSFICAWSYGIFLILFKVDYLDGYIVAPYLFLAPLLQMLFQVIANQFLIIKKTWPSSLMLASGAIVNVFINFVLIPKLGIEGASLATLLGYVVTDIVCTITLIKMKLMVLNMKFLVASGAMVVFFILWRLLFSDKLIVGTIMAFVITAFLIMLYKNDLINFIFLIKNRNTHKDEDTLNLND